mmetsp:Transcript_62671/g.167375  ORF Transcript_62671/g.167375 Transcript_62671/m.167375 type:complete len:329 (-) Transcript_62671:43-1029(-)
MPQGPSQLLQRHCVVLVDLVLGEVGRSEDEDGPVVPSRAAVVAGAEDGDAAAVVLLHVAAPVLRHLVAPNDEPQAVLHAELHRHVGAELDTDPALGLELAVSARGVAPQQVRKDLVLDVCCHWMRRSALGVLDGVYVVDRQGLDPREAPVDDKDLLLHHRAEGEDLEGAHEAPVRHGAVLAEDLIAEAAAAVKVQRVHVLVLVVPPVDDQAPWVGEKEGKEDHEDLARLVASVRDVTVDEIPVLRCWGSKLVKDVKHVCKLAVRVADYNQPSVWRCVGVDHGFGVLQPVGVRELRREVADVLRVQRVRLAIHQVMVHQGHCVLVGHRS